MKSKHYLLLIISVIVVPARLRLRRCCHRRRPPLGNVRVCVCVDILSASEEKLIFLTCSEKTHALPFLKVEPHHTLVFFKVFFNVWWWGIGVFFNVRGAADEEMRCLMVVIFLVVIVPVQVSPTFCFLNRHEKSRPITSSGRRDRRCHARLLSLFIVYQTDFRSVCRL